MLQTRLCVTICYLIYEIMLSLPCGNPHPFRGCMGRSLMAAWSVCLIPYSMATTHPDDVGLSRSRIQHTSRALLPYIRFHRLDRLYVVAGVPPITAVWPRVQPEMLKSLWLSGCSESYQPWLARFARHIAVIHSESSRHMFVRCT